jgi:hypothetical protein
LVQHRRRKVETTGVQRNFGTAHVDFVVGVGRTVPVSSETGTRNEIIGTGILEKTLSIDVSTRILSKSGRATKGMDGVGKSIDGIRVVEGLSTKNLEQKSIASQRRAVVNVLVRLDNPDEFLDGMVEVQLDFVTGRTNRFITSELKLSNQVFMGILGHSATFVSVQEDVVDVQRGGNQRLIVSNGSRDRGANGVLRTDSVGSRVRVAVAVQGSNSPKTFINGANVEIDFNFVILYITILPHLSVYLFVT